MMLIHENLYFLQRIWLELNSKRKERDTAAERLRVYEKRIIEFDQKIIKLKDQQLQIDQLIQEEQSDKIRLDELMVLKSTLEAEVDEVKKKLPSARDDLKEAEKALKLAKDANYKALQSKQKEVVLVKVAKLYSCGHYSFNRHLSYLSHLFSGTGEAE